MSIQLNETTSPVPVKLFPARTRERVPIFDPSPFNPLLPLPVAGPNPRRIPVFPGETSGIRPLPGNTPEFKEYLKKRQKELVDRYDECSSWYNEYNLLGKFLVNWKDITDPKQLWTVCDAMQKELDLRKKWTENKCDYISAEYNHSGDYAERKKFAEDKEKSHEDFIKYLESQISKCIDKVRDLVKYRPPGEKGGGRGEKGDRMPKHERGEDRWR